MKNAMLVSAVVMVCAAMVFAQETPSGGAAGQNSSQTSSATQSTTEQTQSGNAIQGCLTGSAGSYVLTDSEGVAYKIQGDESQLADYINKEVEVTGTVASSSTASSRAGEAAGQAAGEEAGHAAGEAGQAASAAAGASKTLDVSSVKKVADSCSMNK
jgi:hypothetical protein